ncbi:hypothetical protein FQN57_006379 [Myotisia sp. PD_48]|nr:hypothetical protein FQN57_006379 [Myotisia sp. PD_48]
MSAAVVPATTAPLPPMIDHDTSPKPYSLAPLSSAQSSVSPSRGPSNASGDKSTLPDGRRSPNPSRGGGPLSKISIKKEPPSSPSMSGTRHRPRRLDLSSATNHGSSASRGPMTARESGLAMQDVGFACLSPGFQTHDPAMREQLQRSISVRDQQRSIIESRLQKSAKGDGPDLSKPPESAISGPLKTSTKRRPPPGLSIVPPSAAQFANERVVQSAPLNQTFTGRRQAPLLSRQYINHPSDFSASPQIHHTPAHQTNNRLPPISDVFGADALVPREREGKHRNGFGQSNNLGPLPSPGLPGTQSAGTGSLNRPREYRSAEEAVHELAGGREELLPRIVHYSGNRPSSPRSPPGLHSGSGSSSTAPNGTQPQVSHPSQQQQQQQQQQQPPHHHQAAQQAQHQQQHQPPLNLPAAGSRRRNRNEYEHDHGSPPLGNGPDTRYRPPPPSYGPFGAGRDSPDTQRRKKEEFLGLCSRAWDLFHS